MICTWSVILQCARTLNANACAYQGILYARANNNTGMYNFWSCFVTRRGFCTLCLIVLLIDLHCQAFDTSIGGGGGGGGVAWVHRKQCCATSSVIVQSIFGLFSRFPTFHSGLAHYGSEPWNYAFKIIRMWCHVHVGWVQMNGHV